jgi:hypothetical protein
VFIDGKPPFKAPLGQLGCAPNDLRRSRSYAQSHHANAHRDGQFAPPGIDFPAT